MLISPTYRELNREMHSRGTYGLSGARWAGQVEDVAQRHGAQSVLDYGCGAGTLGAALRKGGPLPFEFIEYDPAVSGKETKPARADLVVCTDVLEHIEPDCLYSVLDDIRASARKAVFLVVSLLPAIKTLPDGRNAHLIVESADWWLRKFIDRWAVRVFIDRGGEAVCVGATL